MDGTGSNTAYRAITVTQVSPTLGAEIGNIDLTRPLTDLELAEVKRAFTEHSVLFFRDQEISFEDHARLAEYFGPIGQHVGATTNSQLSDDPRVRKFHFDENSDTVSGNIWHTDQSCAELPPLGSILYNQIIPPNGGGDTMFASMYAAYDGLSDRMKDYLEGLTAWHDGVPTFGPGTPNATHPVVVRHPESGRKLLYVNRGFTKRINGMPATESEGVLRFLWDHCTLPEFCYRFRWEPHSIAFWDNRCAQHRATNDYLPHVRSGYRIQIEGTVAPVAA
ncbi:MAG: taurine dioxygenase [Rhodospirillaceae bacterium]|nr:taurine dioxygenase [Rhodospirillaceae bacterium]|tara:strand:- start:14194 stop:15027 length:834 start_codon:yes stop_codon:yes gene_type:complete